jgi:hypothetical protein
MLEFLGSRFN